MMKISCKLYPVIFILLFLTGLLSGLEFKISKVGPNYVMAGLKVMEGKQPPKLEILQVYDVFERMEIIDGKRIFINFIDSVYLKEVKKEELYFAFIWEGESRILKVNYILAGTERFYAFPGVPFEHIAGEPEIKTDEGAGKQVEKKSGPLPKPPGFAFMVLSGYTIIHNIPYGASEEPPISPGFLTADFVLLFPFNIGLRLTAATRHTIDQFYAQVSGINYRGIVNSFLKFYTELGAGYQVAMPSGSQEEPSVILVAQYGLLFDFRALAKWGYFAIDLYVNGNFPVNTILEGMYLNYGLKVGVRF
jgi:hypothetical protein